jgi:hypothetical protein
MVSTINDTAIDDTFPIAGRDNDSQGFRDNFTYIKSNFTSAKNDITNLQANTAKLNASNNFARNNIIAANFSNCTDNVVDLGSHTGEVTVDMTAGPYQYITASGGNLTLNITGLPASTFVGRVRIQILGDSTDSVPTTRTVTFAVTGGGTIKKSSRVPGTISISSSVNPIILEFWSEGTSLLYLDYLGSFT